MGFSSKILNNSVSSLVAQQAIIATTSNNIANANTPGYARRTVELSNRGSSSRGGEISVGNGVEIGNVTRSVDAFVEKLLNEASAEKAGADTEKDFYSRMERLFSLDESRPTVGSALTEFYNSLNQLSSNPASLELRANVMERGKDLVNTISSTFKALANLQNEADQRLNGEVLNVNTFASQIADLNGKIRTRESTGEVAADERDQRQQLLEKLGEKISFSAIEDSEGQVNLYLGKGFALVSGTTARELTVTTSPSFSGGSLPPSLSGGPLSHIVFDYNSGSGTAHIDLTQSIQSGEGILGGLLAVRGYNDPSNTSAFQANGAIVEMASRIESVTRALITTMNNTYQGAVDENTTTATVFDSSSGDLTGARPAPNGLFDFTYSGTKDSNSDGRITTTDLTASGIDSFSSVLSFAITDPRRIAAALDTNATSGATAFAPGDGRNITRLVAALDASTTSFSVGSYAFVGNFNQQYNESVTHMGSMVERAASTATVAGNNLLTAQSRRDSVSSVNLDEEFANLIKFQRAFQASARMIKVADELLSQIVDLI